MEWHTATAGIVAPVSAGSTLHTAFERAAREDYDRWLAHVRNVGGCTRPVRLVGRVEHVHPHTGEITATTATGDLPDGVIYTSCGNRRASVCPACSETYRADTYQLVKAGLVGGKGVPTSVAGHPCVFLTLTAPTFGPVHSRRTRGGRARPCRPRRNPTTCAHGVRLACTLVHAEGDRSVGTPLCLDCYDHDAQVVFNAYAGELWRRTTTTLTKRLKRLGARASFAKVAEMQHRGVVHFHALLRLDGLHPHTLEDPVTGLLVDVPAPPPAGVGVETLSELVTSVAAEITFTTPGHVDHPSGWQLGWGEQIDARPVRAPGTSTVTEGQVAAYLAKYATKATETAGLNAPRLTHDTVTIYATPNTHTGRLVDACWRLGHPRAHLHPADATRNRGRLAYHRLRRWAHMLGFGGHFSTKSRRYSTTLTALRTARITWRREHAHRARLARLREQLRDATAETETTLLVTELVYAGNGWHTTGDALLAATAAAQARDHHRTARDELHHAHAA